MSVPKLRSKGFAADLQRTEPSTAGLAALSEAGIDSYDKLYRALADTVDDPKQRKLVIDAAFWLSRSMDRRAVPLLIRLVPVVDDEVLRWVLIALGLMGGRKTLAALLSVATDTKRSFEARYEAVSHLWDEDERAVAYLRQLMFDVSEHSELRGRAIEMVNFVDGMEQEFGRLLTDSEADVCFWAAYRFGRGPFWEADFALDALDNMAAYDHVVSEIGWHNDREALLALEDISSQRGLVASVDASDQPGSGILASLQRISWE